MSSSRRQLLLVLLASVLLLCCFSAPLTGQSAVRPEMDWRTISTRHFDIHYPADAERWTHAVAARMDAVRDSVAMVVGHAPENRVTVLVEDPYNSANGFAIPFLRGPVIMLWPTPVAAPHVLANNRGWGEVLAVHEYAHIAHLTRPSRNGWQRLLWSLLPVELGPVTRRSPRWLFEGYATYVEGWLTGSGRPNGAWRAAILRQWALEGRLPTYSQLDGTESFQGGAMAYLAGSAFLEWLDARALAETELVGVTQPGESLVRLWRRMSARHDRDFTDAFRGTFGDAPHEAYGRFTAELTGKALAMRDSLRAAGAPEGTLIQRFAYGTGQPALSPHGDRLALVRRERDRPGRLVVLDVGAGADTAALRKMEEARDRLLQRDPEDVPAVRAYPIERDPLATLEAVGGRVAEQPRFMPDGRSILFSRLEPTADGAYRADLSIWHWDDGGVRRVTHGAGIREADPTPDGLGAVGVRCDWGICDVIRIDLTTGGLTTLLPGAPDVQYAGPRVAHDGRIAVAEQRGGLWRVMLLQPNGLISNLPSMADVSFGADSASRYAPAFVKGEGAIVVTSESGGIPHLERLDLATGNASPITRPTGAHFSADVASDGRIYFLALHAGGHDLRLAHLDSVPPSPAFGPPFGAAFGGDPSGRLAPASPPRFGAPVGFDSALVSPRPYSELPGLPLVLPGGSHAADGGFVSAMLSASDPVGRLAWMLEAGIGDRSSWRGGGLSAAWRRWPIHLQGNVGTIRSEPSRQHRPIADPTAEGALDSELGAATLALSWDHVFGTTMPDVISVRLGGSIGRVRQLAAGDRDDRLMAYADARITNSLSRDTRVLTHTLALLGATGRTGQDGWSRGTISSRLYAGVQSLGIGAEVTAGAVSSGTPVWERFVVGGTAVPFVDAAILSQRVPISALPSGALVGERLLKWRAEAQLGLPFGIRPYLSSVSVDRDFDEWQRFGGLELRGTFDRVPFVRLPTVSLELGWARLLSGADEGRDTFHAGVRYRP